MSTDTIHRNAQIISEEEMQKFSTPGYKVQIVKATALDKVEVHPVLEWSEICTEAGYEEATEEELKNLLND